MTEVLANEIKLSRTPIRDALRKLETDGLVTIKPHLGASVKKMELKEFREMCDLRLALESHAAGLAATNRTDADVNEIQFALEGMRRLTTKIASLPHDPALISELVREDVRFHIAVMSAAKNDLMKKEILRLHLVNRVVSGPATLDKVSIKKVDADARRATVLAKHNDIFGAIVRSDARAAKHEMEFHLQEMIDHNLVLMTRAETGVVARELTLEELAYSS